jgi:hypothetical protein
MTWVKEMWGYIWWGVTGLVIAVPELLAALWRNVMPFPTISETCANLEIRHDWVAVLFLGAIVAVATQVVLNPWRGRAPDEPKRDTG